MRHRGVEDVAAGDAFCRFSLALYARPGVAAALIALQDRAGRNVNVILFALWAGSRDHPLDAAALAAAEAAIAPLDAAAVVPLRQLRRHLKDMADPDLAALRQPVLALELAAERRVQARLAALLGERSAIQTRDNRGVFAAANLALYLGAEATAVEAGTLLDALASLARRLRPIAQCAGGQRSEK